MLLSLALFAGCSKTPAGDDTKGSTDAAVAAIKARGVLKVGVKEDVPGFGLVDTATGKYAGLEIEIAKLIAKDIFGDETKVQFTAVTAATRGPLLDNGDIDMVIATFTIKPDRLETYNFTTPYYTDAVAMLVKKDSGITQLTDLAGKQIGVAMSATSKAAITEAAAAVGVTLTDANFSEFATYPEIKAALDSKRVDVFSVDGSILTGYVDDTTVILDARFSPQEYGIATKKQNTELATYVDNLVKGWLSDGTIDRLITDLNVVPPYEG
jgi:putative glutamine transport system substrate-binding protein